VGNLGRSEMRRKVSLEREHSNFGQLESKAWTTGGLELVENVWLYSPLTTGLVGADRFAEFNKMHSS
jgi:hypothetical protein